jgi:hypothetical protein
MHVGGPYERRAAMAVGTALRTTVVGVLVLAAAACGEDGSTSVGAASQSLYSSLLVRLVTDGPASPAGRCRP